MTVKKKAPAKKKAAAPKKKAVKATPKKKAPVKKKVTSKRCESEQKRAKRLGPVPKYHLSHREWDRPAAMEVICDLMMSSSKGLKRICDENDDLPCFSGVMKWLNSEAKEGGSVLLDMYMRAKRLQMDYLVDETIEIVDNEASNPVVVNGNLMLDPKTGEPLKVTDSASVNHAKIRAESRRWVAERLAHRKYGNRLELSGDPERPLQNSSDEALDGEIAALLKKGGFDVSKLS